MKALLSVIGMALCLSAQSQSSLQSSVGTSPDSQALCLVAADDASRVESTGEIRMFTNDPLITGNKLFSGSIPASQPLQYSNEPLYGAFISTGLTATTDGSVPFWMRSRQYGNNPIDGLSGSLIAGAHKDYVQHRNPLFDWGAGVEARVNAGSDSEIILIEAYAKARLGIMQLKAGRSRDITGLVDTTLSSGAFAMAGNTLGIPKIEFSFHDYWEVPLTRGLIAIKGTLAHGWMGNVELNKEDDNTVLNYSVDSYFHQKSAYGRLGKPNWKVKLYGGFNHQVVWGNETQIYPEWGLSKAKTFQYVFIGKAYGNNSVPASKVGNHMGSIDQAIEWDMGPVFVTAYHQFFYEVGGLIKLANATDGLWGVSVKNQTESRSRFQWHKFLFEFLYSKSQGGEIDSKPRPSGSEDYYNNFLYYDGWSYQGENLGNPLFTSKKYIREGLPTKDGQYFPNNRLMAFHAGADFRFDDWQCKALLTYSVNWGTYLTSPGTRLFGDVVAYFPPPYFPTVNQFSASIESRKQLRKGYELAIQLATDQGDLLYNSVGAAVSITKRW